LIESLGGGAAVARMCGISGPSVCSWRTQGIPAEWLEFFQSRAAVQLAAAGDGVFAPPTSKVAKATAAARAEIPDVAALALRLRQLLPEVRAACAPPVAAEIAAVAAGLLVIAAGEVRSAADGGAA
jgi:hypothetical protein